MKWTPSCSLERLSDDVRNSCVHLSVESFENIEGSGLRLIKEYVALIREIVRDLSPENHRLAVQLAMIPDQIRGFGHIKHQSILMAKSNESEAPKAFRGGANYIARAAE